MTDIKPLSSLKAEVAAKIAALEEIIDAPRVPSGNLSLTALTAIEELDDCMRANPDNAVSAGKLPESTPLAVAIAACKGSAVKPVGP